MENVLNTRLNSYIDRIMDDFQTPGISFSIVKDDAIFFAAGYGFRQLNEVWPVDENTIFGIASISKSFTAMVLGMLVEEGRLNWDDPVTKHLPAFKLYDANATREMTVLDLLIHRSGLRTESGGTLWYGSDYSRMEIIDRIRYLKPVSSFRSKYAYQNISYLVAGEIVHSISGQTWDDFITQRIFNPLEMMSSSTSIKDLAAKINVAMPHKIIDGVLKIIPHRNYDNVGSAASINTSVKELSSYARLLLNKGMFEGQRLFSTKIAQDLWTPHTVIPLPDKYPDVLRNVMPQYHNAYGLGWVLQDYKGMLKVSHSGGIDGLRSLLTMVPEKNLGVIVFANNEGPAAWVLTHVILSLLHGLDPEIWYGTGVGWYKQQLKEKIVDIGSPIMSTTPSLGMNKYCGNYWSDLAGEIEVSFDGEQMVLHFPHTKSFTAKLDHWHYDTFRVKWDDDMIPDGLITFAINSAGEVAEILLDQSKILDVDFVELHPIKRV